MKISESWLREWVNPNLTTQALANQLTMAGLEVDTIAPVAGNFDGVVVARVIATRPHPQADRLTLCEIDKGDGLLIPVVCGASNVRAGLTVALATMGAQLPGDLVIKETKLRGELSQGMLCAANELGLADRSEGILELADDAPLGMDVRDYLALDDQVLDIDLTPNRGDCLSLLGVARDVAALNRLVLQQPALQKITPTFDKTLQVHLDTPSACPSYVGRVISGINPHASTPLLIKERLRRADMRPTHPVVDVLNYVMLELGQPMHAFDLQKISGDLRVRFAQKSEQLRILGGQELQLDEQVLVIADDEHVLAMAGVMGGEDSAVQAQTTDIWLEAAFFDPLAVAGVARRFGLSSDASHRFERGVDPQIAERALEAATGLLQTIVGGKIGPMVHCGSINTAYSSVIISFKPSLVQRLTGMIVAENEMEAILQRLGMTVVRQAQGWDVTVPSWRFDLSLDVDLVEEIIRVVGYDQIPNVGVATTLQAGTIDATELAATQMISFLAHRGYQETISYSFVDPELQQALYPDSPAKVLKNPISSELSAMRVGLWPGLLAAMLHNIHRQHLELKLCETGKVFLMTAEGAVVEKLSCAGLITGDHGHFNWTDVAGRYDFYDMKGDLEALFATLHQQHEIEFVAGEHPALHPGKTAQIMKGSQLIGWIGALHPRLLDVFDLSADVILFELLVSPLQEKQRIEYQSISKYPQIRRDLSLLVDEHLTAAAIETVVRGVVAAEYLKAFYIFDVYTGGGLALEQKKSVALGLLLQSDDRTLVDAEINAIMTAVVSALEQQLKAVLRTVAE